MVIAVRVNLALKLIAAEVALSNKGRRAKARAGGTGSAPAMSLRGIHYARADNRDLDATLSKVTERRDAEVGGGITRLGALLAASTTEESSVSAVIIGVAISGRHAFSALAETTAGGGVAEGGGDRATNRSDDGRRAMMIIIVAVFILLLPVVAAVAVMIVVITVHVTELQIINVTNTKTVDSDVSRV